MRGGDGFLPSYIKATDPRPVKREKAKPTGNAAKDGYTRYSRRAPWGAPGDFASPSAIKEWEDFEEKYPPMSEVNDA